MLKHTKNYASVNEKDGKETVTYNFPKTYCNTGNKTKTEKNLLLPLDVRVKRLEEAGISQEIFKKKSL